MEPFGTTAAWKQKEKLQKECRELLVNSKTVEEFDEIYARYLKKYKVLIACAILGYEDKRILRRAILDLSVFMPDAATRRKQLAEVIERDNKLYTETLSMGMEVLEEVSKEVADSGALSKFLEARDISLSE